MEKYLHVKSYHFLAQNMGVFNTLATHAFRVSDESHLEDEKTHLLKVLKHSGCNKLQCPKDFFKAGRGFKIKKEPNDWFSRVHLSFIQGTTNKIARILRKHRVPSTFRPFKTIQISLRTVKDFVDTKTIKDVLCNPLLM